MPCIIAASPKPTEDVALKRNTLNFLVDLVSLLVILALLLTGLVMKFILPPGTGGRHGGERSELWALGRHDWGEIHFWLAVAVVALMVLHVALHWSWVTGTLRRWFRPEAMAGPAWVRNLYGLAFLAALVILIGGFWALAAATATHVEAPGDQQEADREDHATVRGPDGQPVPIRGRMSLAEIAEATGIPVERLIVLLELDPGVNRHAGIAQLGLDPPAVRRRIAAAQ